MSYPFDSEMVNGTVTPQSESSRNATRYSPYFISDNQASAPLDVALFRQKVNYEDQYVSHGVSDANEWSTPWTDLLETNPGVSPDCLSPPAAFNSSAPPLPHADGLPQQTDSTPPNPPHTKKKNRGKKGPGSPPSRPRIPTHKPKSTPPYPPKGARPKRPEATTAPPDACGPGCPPEQCSMHGRDSLLAFSPPPLKGLMPEPTTPLKPQATPNDVMVQLGDIKESSKNLMKDFYSVDPDTGYFLCGIHHFVRQRKCTKRFKAEKDAVAHACDYFNCRPYPCEGREWHPKCSKMFATNERRNDHYSKKKQDEIRIPCSNWQPHTNPKSQPRPASREPEVRTQVPDVEGGCSPAKAWWAIAVRMPTALIWTDSLTMTILDGPICFIHPISPMLPSAILDPCAILKDHFASNLRRRHSLRKAYTFWRTAPGMVDS